MPPEDSRTGRPDEAARNTADETTCSQSTHTHRPTGCPCGCLSKPPWFRDSDCLANRPVPQAPACNCGQLDAGDRKRAVELGIWCVGGCAYRRLQEAVS